MDLLKIKYIGCMCMLFVDDMVLICETRNQYMANDNYGGNLRDDWIKN